MNALNAFGSITVTNEWGQSTEQPCYVCGHCSDVIILRADRVRERKSCLTCGNLICEKKQLCQTHCTPLHAMARDGFQDTGRWGKYVNAIMRGAATEEEADAVNQSLEKEL